MKRPASIRAVVRRLASGEPVDWHAELDAAEHDDASARSMLEALRVLDDIGQARRSLDVDTGGALPSPALGRWGTMRLLEVIGRGSHGIVYRAYDEQLNREVAVKLVRADVRAGLVSRFLEEARLLARVKHVNVVTVHGAEVFNAQPGLWMERLDGTTLQELVARQGPLEPSEAARVAVEVCRGLAAVHRAGVLHCDLKAENVMRERDSRVVLTDFSTSSLMQGAARLAGTPLYMAPEILAGAPATARSDVYSTGVLLYFLLTGRVPVQGADVDELRAAHREGSGQSLGSVRPDVPASLTGIVTRTLSRDPAHRPASASELESELQEFLRGHGHRHRRWRTPAAAILVTATVLTAGIVSTILVGRAPASPTPVARSRPLLLIGAFENATSHAHLAASLQYLLERELTSSASIRVMSRARVDDTLRLMQRPLETALDRPTAREIGLRDGGLGQVIIGRIESVGSALRIAATLVDVATDEAAGTVSAEAASLDALPGAVRVLSDGIRRALGETPVDAERWAPQFERVTTPSVDALRLYSESYRLGARNEWQPALELVRLAVEADPGFPAARIWLAWCLMRANAPPEIYLAEAAKALELAPQATEWERLWIIGSHHNFVGDDERAIASFEATLRLNPEHYWAAGNIVIGYGRLGRYGDAVPLARRLADLRPHDHRTLNIAFSAMRRALRYAEASDLAARMREVHRLEQRYWISDPWIFDAARSWASKNLAATQGELERVTEEASAAGDAAQASVLPEVAALYLAIGRPDEARRVLALVSDVPRRQLHLAIVALHEARPAEARTLLQHARFGTNDLRDVWDRVWVLARAGAPDEARRLTTLVREPVPSGSMMVEASRARKEWLDAAEAEIALATGNASAAVPLLQRALPALMADVTVTPVQMYRAAEALADALTTLGRHDEAKRTLEAVLDRHERETFAGAPYWAERCAARLAALVSRR